MALEYIKYSCIKKTAGLSSVHTRNELNRVEPRAPYRTVTLREQPVECETQLHHSISHAPYLFWPELAE